MSESGLLPQQLRGRLLLCCKMVVQSITFKSVDKKIVTIQMRDTEQNFLVVLFIMLCKVVSTFGACE